MKRKFLAAAILTLSLGQAFAETSNANFQSTATLNGTCTISAPDINFGEIIPESSDKFKTQISRLYLTCSKDIQATLSLSTGSSGNFAQREMMGTAGNTDKLKYNISRTPGGPILGDGTNGSFSWDGIIGTGTQINLTMTARVPLNQFLKPDNYSDSLTATISY